MVVAALQSVSTDATTHLLAQIAVLLATAFGFGALARKIRQPAVIGYVAAGVVCGPSVFGRVTPGLAGDLFPGDAVTSAMLLGIAGLGSVCLLALTGLEIDLPTVRRWGRLLPGRRTRKPPAPDDRRLRARVDPARLVRRRRDDARRLRTADGDRVRHLVAARDGRGAR